MLSTPRKFRVGLTGGIASGKSTVAAMLSELGAGVVDTDIVAREVVEPGEPALAAIAETFGNEVILESGALDRAALRRIVFGDKTARSRLEAILHPPIRARTLERVKQLATPYAVIVVPLLVETNFNELVDRVLVVDCPREIQLERLLQREGMTPDEAEAMLDAQVSRDTRNRRADDLIDNSSDLENLRQQVEILHRSYLAPGAGRNNDA